MSASRFTAMRRTVVNANLTKVHYPTNIAKNYDALYATIGCNPLYSLFTYADPPRCACPPPPPPPPCSIIYDGLFSSNDECLEILDGGFSNNNFRNILNGGESRTNCAIIRDCYYYDGLYSRSNNFLPAFNGLDSRPNNQPSLDGGLSVETCPLPPSCILYDGRYSMSVIDYNIDGGGASDNYPFYLDGGSAVFVCSICCLPCIVYDGMSSVDGFYPPFNGLNSLNIPLSSLDGGNVSTECPCFCRC